MSYTHISSFQRNELSALLRAKAKQKKIAGILKKHRSSVWRERQRNGKDAYNAGMAKKKNGQRRVMANQRFRKIDNNERLRKYIIKRLKDCWSPEQIAGRLKIKNGKVVIGKDSIYSFIYDKRPDLVRYLRCQKGKYRRRRGTKIREKQREELKKRRIDKRPVIVEKRERIGDWEGDTIVSCERVSAILTHVERRSGYLMADKLQRATAEATREKTVERFSKVPKSKKLTLTYDNGKEFSYYELIEMETGVVIYFAFAYHSWERGTNENTNGLMRQFFPKGSSFVNIDQEMIDEVVRLISDRPRKRLGYLTPREVFNSKCCALD